jgi:hypothetical protein
MYLLSVNCRLSLFIVAFISFNSFATTSNIVANATAEDVDLVSTTTAITS